MVPTELKNPCYTLYLQYSGWYWMERMGKYFNLGMQILLAVLWTPSSPKETEEDHV